MRWHGDALSQLFLSLSADYSRSSARIRSPFPKSQRLFHRHHPVFHGECSVLSELTSTFALCCREAVGGLPYRRRCRQRRRRLLCGMLLALPLQKQSERNKRSMGFNSTRSFVKPPHQYFEYLTVRAGYCRAVNHCYRVTNYGLVNATLSCCKDHCNRLPCF